MIAGRISLAGLGIAASVFAASLLTVDPDVRPQPTGMLLQPVDGTPRFSDAPPFMVELDHDYEVYLNGQILDVAISRLSGLTYKNRVGSYPTGRIGMACNTTACNVGNVDVPWFAQMDPRHPFIFQNLYRIHDGRLEQVGLSWAKHGFYAADSGAGCGDCQYNRADDYLNLGCQDTYSDGNNSDRTWLGPRYEINPRTGDWEPCGSHFDNASGTPNDCRQSHFSGGHGPIDHLLRADEQHLTDANDEYFFETLYVVKDDVNPLNNVAYRPVVFDYNGSTWDITHQEQMVLYPVMMTWGDMQSIASPRDEGDAMVSVEVNDNGNGTWRYSYAVYNHSVDRQIGGLHVPHANGAAVSGLGFHAPLEDEEPYDTSDWSSDLDGTDVSWACESFDVNEWSNSLRYGTVYTFWFDADQPPSLTTATLDMFQPGASESLTVNTLGPGGGSASGLQLESTELVRGQNTQITVSGADPGETVYFLYSTEGLGKSYSSVLDLDLDMALPIVNSASAIADGNGVAMVDAEVPDFAPNARVAIQAVVYRPTTTSLKSNVALRSIMD